MGSENRTMPIARWTDNDFPPYSYVTGKFPHPLRDENGHGCAGPPPPSLPPTNDDWCECLLYLWGVDLFNAGYYWEAHEAWEGVWHAVGRKGPVADLQKALIKLAAAGVKAREGRVIGVRRHANRSVELTREVANTTQADRYFGVNLDSLSQLGTKVSEAADETVKAAQEGVVVILPALELSP